MSAEEALRILEDAERAAQTPEDKRRFWLARVAIVYGKVDDSTEVAFRDAQLLLAGAM